MSPLTCGPSLISTGRTVNVSSFPPDFLFSSLLDCEDTTCDTYDMQNICSSIHRLCYGCLPVNSGLLVVRFLWRQRLCVDSWPCGVRGFGALTPAVKVNCVCICVHRYGDETHKCQQNACLP